MKFIRNLLGIPEVVTVEPIPQPTYSPALTLKPSFKPTLTMEPTFVPTLTLKPSFKPTSTPTLIPTLSMEPSFKPTLIPTLTMEPTLFISQKEEGPSLEYMTIIIIPLLILCVSKPNLIVRWWRVVTCWSKRHPNKEDKTEGPPGE